MSGQGWFSVPVTPMVRSIMMSLLVIYLAQALLVLVGSPGIVETITLNTVLVPETIFSEWRLWTLVTYGWLHDIGLRPHLDLLVCLATGYGLYRFYRSGLGQRELFLFLIVAFFASTLVQMLGFGAPLHLAGNLLVLYFFGHNFEPRWGPRRFLTFWILCIIGGGLLTGLVALMAPSLTGGSVVGASAGTMGLIAAFAVYYPNATVAYGFVIPIRGKHILYIALGFDALALLSGSPVAVFAHLGGVIVGLALTTGYWRPAKIKRWVDKKRPPPPDKKRHLRLVKDEDDDEPPRYLH